MIKSSTMKDQQNSERQQLSPDWFLKGRMDFEYKKYILLAYLKQAEKDFEHNKLYPHLSELVFHYRNLKSFLEKKQNLYQEFPEELTGVDLDQFRLYYKKVIQDDELMEVIDQIVSSSIQDIKVYLDEGAEIFEFVENQIEVKPVGLVSVNPESGYFFIRNGDDKETRVYYYQISALTTDKDQYQTIKARYINSFKRSFSNTYEAIKKELIKAYQDFQNPGSYAIESRLTFPVNETLLPVAKRLLVRYIKT